MKVSYTIIQISTGEFFFFFFSTHENMDNTQLPMSRSRSCPTLMDTLDPKALANQSPKRQEAIFSGTERAVSSRNYARPEAAELRMSLPYA